jgi:prevent-host-death family protein
MGRKPKSSRVGVRELRENLSMYLDRVKKGEALTVTDHGAAVALLHPLPPAIGVVDRLIAQGIARPATRSIRDIPRPLSKSTLDKPLSEILREMREDER